MIAVVFLFCFDGLCDKILLWLYSDDDFLSHGARFMIAFALLQSLGVFGKDEKVNMYKADNEALPKA